MKNELNKKYIRNRLNKIIKMNSIDDNNTYANIQKVSSSFFSDDAEMFIISENTGIKKKIIHFAFKYKEKIKKIPYIGNCIIKKKNKMLQKAKNIKFKNVIDVEDIINMNSESFIIAAYNIFLDREPDSEGFEEFRKISYEGASNGAIAYLFATSSEFNNKYVVKNLKKYHKEYKKYIVKHRLLKVPLIGGIFKLFLLYSKLNMVLNKLYITNTRIDNIFEIIESNNKMRDISLHNKINTVEEITNYVKLQSDEINEKMQKAESELEDFFYQYNQQSVQLTDTVLDQISTTNETLNNVLNIGTSITEKVDLLSNIIVQNTDAVLGQISRNNETINRGLEIDTSISEKIDLLPNFIAQNNVKNKSIFTSSSGVTAVQVGDFILGVPSEEWGLAMFLSLNGYFEHGSEKLFCSVVKEGMTVIDIGANLGIYTLHALKAGCSVYSYEPTPATFELLKQNIKVNGFAESQRSHIYNLAVGESEHAANFAVCKAMCGHNHISNEDENDDIIKIDVIKLDDHVPLDKKIDFIKIDVEGEELNVLKGMKRIILNNPQIMILIEFAPENLIRAGSNPIELLKLINEYNLKILQIDENTGTTTEVIESDLLEENSVNLLLTNAARRF